MVDDPKGPEAGTRRALPSFAAVLFALGAVLIVCAFVACGLSALEMIWRARSAARLAIPGAEHATMIALICGVLGGISLAIARKLSVKQFGDR